MLGTELDTLRSDALHGSLDALQGKSGNNRAVRAECHRNSKEIEQLHGHELGCSFHAKSGDVGISQPRYKSRLQHRNYSQLLDALCKITIQQHTVLDTMSRLLP